MAARALELLLDLMLPRRCVGCGSPVAVLCPRCLPAGGPLRVPCGRVEVVAAAAYDGGLRRALISYKERGRRDLAGPLAGLLGRAVRAALAGVRAPPGRVVLVAIPSARSAAAARGGDHLVRLGRRAAVVAGVRVATDVLTLTRTVHDSAGLGPAARESNLHGALRACAPPAGRTALIIDDIVTTGTTLREAQRALTAAGWPIGGAAVVAATPLRAMATPLAAPRGAV